MVDNIYEKYDFEQCPCCYSLVVPIDKGEYWICEACGAEILFEDEESK